MNSMHLWRGLSALRTLQSVSGFSCGCGTIMRSRGAIKSLTGSCRRPCWEFADAYKDGSYLGPAAGGLHAACMCSASASSVETVSPSYVSRSRQYPDEPRVSV
jgi:hypothetical protein